MGNEAQLTSEISRLTEELSRAETAKVRKGGCPFFHRDVQTEAQDRIAEMEMEVARLTEEANNTARSYNVLLEESRECKENLAKRLRDFREDQRKLEEKFLLEVSAKTRLANLYKSRSEEHSNNAKGVEDLNIAVNKLVELLKEINQNQEDIVKEHNWTLIDRLEDLSKLVSEITDSRLKNIVEDSSVRKSQLLAIIKHLRGEKDLMAGRLDVSLAETDCLLSQLDYQQSNFGPAAGAPTVAHEVAPEVAQKNNKTKKQKREQRQKLSWQIGRSTVDVINHHPMDRQR